MESTTASRKTCWNLLQHRFTRWWPRDYSVCTLLPLVSFSITKMNQILTCWSLLNPWQAHCYHSAGSSWNDIRSNRLHIRRRHVWDGECERWKSIRCRNLCRWRLKTANWAWVGASIPSREVHCSHHKEAQASCLIMPSYIDILLLLLNHTKVLLENHHPFFSLEIYWALFFCACK